jgi:hypothetical protein
VSAPVSGCEIFQRKEKTKMNIAEMRSALDSRSVAQGLGGFPSSAPDWVVRGVYEKSQGLPLTPLPAGIRRFKNEAEFRSFVTRTKPAKPEVMTSDREAAQRRVLLASISLLQ